MARKLMLGLLCSASLLPLLCSCSGNTSSLSPRSTGFGSGFNRRSSTPAGDATSPQVQATAPRQIAFVSNESGHPDVWLMQPDGSRRASVTSDEAVETHPRWASNGLVLVFLRKHEGKTEVIRYDVAEREQRELLSVETGELSHLCTSLSGDDIAFVQRSEEGASIQAVSLDAEKPRKLHDVPEGAAVQSLSWLGDGMTLAFVTVAVAGETESEEAAESETEAVTVGVQLLDAEKGATRSLTTNALDRNVVGAPRGGAVAFLRGDSLYVVDEVDSDKSTPRRVAEEVKELPVAWSPDGTRLAYWPKSETPTVAFVAAEGGEARTVELSAEAVPELGLTWSPDGTTVGFLRRQVEGDAERHLLYSVSVTGGKERRLTEALADHSEVVWAS